MALRHLEENTHYRLGIWKIEETESMLRELTGQIDPPPFTNSGKRMEYMAVRALAASMGIDPATIAYLPSGKPYLTGCSLNISISHTKGYAAILLSEHFLSGIDIEQKSQRVFRVRKKFMHPEEELRLKESYDSRMGKALSGENQRLKQTEVDETTALLLHWCTKESLFKAIPDEGVDFSKELQILDFSAKDSTGHFSAKALRSNTTFQIDYRIEEDFVLTCCFSEESK
jgi:4'-phosphopantetheinyl transferase